MKKIGRSILYFIIIVALEIIIPNAFSGVYKKLGDIRIILFLNHIICFIIPAIIFFVITKNSPKKILRINKISLKQLVIVIAIAFLCQPIMMACSAISMLFFNNNLSEFVGSIQGTPFIVMLLLMAVMPAITEEVTIRGIVLSGFDKLSDFKAALITGLLFGIFHLDLQQFLYASVIGVILGYVVRITNSILSSVTMHFVINGTSVVMQKILTLQGTVSDAQSTDLTSLSMPEKLGIMYTYLFIGIIFVVIVYFVLQKLKKESSKNVLQG